MNGAPDLVLVEHMFVLQLVLGDELQEDVGLVVGDAGRGHLVQLSISTDVS